MALFSARANEIKANLMSVQQRIAAGCAAADRDPSGVRLIVVTKTYPASDIRLLSELGVTDIGENRDQEARVKRLECADLPLTWHMIGQVQQKKAISVVSWADVVHSLDRPELVDRIGRAAQGANRHIGIFLQVSLDPEQHANRGGASMGEIEGLVDHVLSWEHLDLLGVMGVAPHPGDPRSAFARLSLASALVMTKVPSADQISAGMSGDLEAALYRGATHVRLGGAVLGIRTLYP